ncbi:MAG: AAA family ATPase, partial [Bifidobacteriaceae bacterium]|nr:AAA family ATPase [Bifidobacteriaceae bacterium]
MESDRSTADDYYLGEGDALASWAVSDAQGEVTAAADLGPEAYAAWVDWAHPLTGERMGVPRTAGDGRKGSPRFQEMIVNAPKSLSVAAALHPDVSVALDAAQADAADEIRRYLALHATTRVGPRGAQEVVQVAGLQTVPIVHHTSRAGDPHRHVHFQIGTRVWAAGAWRGLDGVALFKMQGAIRAIGTAVIAAHPQLAAVLDRHGLTLDPETGEVIELEPFNQVMSKRGAQVEANLQRLVREWEASHPGETMSRTTSGRLQASAWAQDRPAKKPATLAGEAAWVAELHDAGYDENGLRRAAPVRVVSLDALDPRWIANRALDRCAAGASAWTPHTICEQVAALLTAAGVRATPGQLRQFTDQAASLARADCLSVLPLGAPAPEHVACLTSVDVIAAETRLRDLLTGLTADGDVPLTDVETLAAARGLDDGQARAAAAVASTDRLVVVEGAAGSGKTSMLGVALAALQVAPAVAGKTRTGGGPDGRGRDGVARVLAPTLRAAQVAQEELGVPATSVAALVHAHGWRWNRDGIWARLNIGAIDPDTGRAYTGPPAWSRLAPGERVIVDEAGMLDQDTAIALLTTVTEAGAAVALVGDRAQLPAVGRGGVLDMAAQARGCVFDMAEVHRFTSPGYAALTLAMRGRDDPGRVFDRLAALGLVRLHASEDAMREHVAAVRRDGEAVTVATNQEAAEFNERVRARRVASGLVDDTCTVTGSDGLPIGAGDLIQTRRNDNHLGVANRQTWTVQRVDYGEIWVSEAGTARRASRLVRLPAEYVNEHAHLSYAATAYGVQGATVPASHTILADSLSAAGLYVGMTRGRTTNSLHVVAENLTDAREQFIDAMGRDRADLGLEAATRRAVQDVTGLVADGPAAIVNAEKTRLAGLIAQAEANAERWQQQADALNRQRHQHQQARDQLQAIAQAARAQHERTRAAVLAA